MISYMGRFFVTEEDERAYRTARELGLFNERRALSKSEVAFGKSLVAGRVVTGDERAVIGAAKEFVSKENSSENLADEDLQLFGKLARAVRALKGRLP
jgi:hypothetical protein